MTRTFEFVAPEWFWFLALVPLLVFWFWKSRRRHNAEWKISALNTADQTSKFWALAKSFLWVLRIAAVVLIVIALARPRYVDQSTRIKTSRGIDIVMAIDVSASMLARDLKPNRLEALKEVAARFIDNRPNDRLGLVGIRRRKLYENTAYQRQSIGVVSTQVYRIQHYNRRRYRYWDGARYCG